MTIGLLAIFLNESEYVERWVKYIRPFLDSFDRALVVDGGSFDGTLERLQHHSIPVASRPFEHHFADQRNWGGEQLQTDWIFELDADEFVSAPLGAGLLAIIADAAKSGTDCVGIPRLNFLDNLLLPGPGHRNLDFQYRLHRSGCRWRGAVHEEVVGYRARYELRVEDGHFLVHDKSGERYRNRNAYYRTLKP